MKEVYDLESDGEQQGVLSRGNACWVKAKVRIHHMLWGSIRLVQKEQRCGKCQTKV